MYADAVSIDTATLARIEAVAAEVDFTRGFQRAVAAAVYYPARLAGTLVRGAGWMVAAWRVGYADGRKRT
jgi:hypothetical protein